MKMAKMKIRGKVCFISDLKVNEQKLSPTEKLILNTRKGSEDFTDLSESEAKVCLDKIILHGSAIAGSRIPNTEFFADVLAEQVRQLIVQQEAVGVSFEEIILAMQLNVSGKLVDEEHEPVIVDFTGAFFNVAYLAKILKYYFVVRHTLDRKIQNQIDGYE